MKIVYLPTATDDLIWFRSYYRDIFPAGDEQAKAQFRKVRQALLAHPEIGEVIDAKRGIREFSIPRTPFSTIYYLSGVEIRILRLWDARSNRPSQF